MGHTDQPNQEQAGYASAYPKPESCGTTVPTTVSNPLVQITPTNAESIASTWLSHRVSL